ncbi:MAG: fatty-acid oxidation protein subunit alpha [Deltaproteobacteria bacterium]|nr:fatty-acid oxidation protein subunit alpha [Deltaproteobacteria bacterium]
MAVRDTFHEAVRNALVKEGWTITHDPLSLSFGGVDLYIDLGAEKMIAAEREGQRIAVEIKSFSGPSLVSDFHAALGQFLNYRLVLEAQDAARDLYLAVPLDAHAVFFSLPFAQAAIQRYQLRLLVYDGQKEEIVQWQS